jgi:iron complex outermembrane recepter protein
MHKLIALYLMLAIGMSAWCQPNNDREIRVTVYSATKVVLPNANVSLLRSDSSLVRTLVTDNTGLVVFKDLVAGHYIASITVAEYQPQYTPVIDLVNKTTAAENVALVMQATVLSNVQVTGKKPFVQFLPDKTVINVEAGISNAGATVLEVLERSPGVTVDRDGNISLKGKPSVQVMIDGKLTQLSGPDLQNLLSGMNASQVETIELIENPGAKYDAAGNAGIINIRTKKNRQRGFNGSAGTTIGQGKYPKNNNNLQLNFRTGKFNFFSNFTYNFNRSFFDLDAVRIYYRPDGSVSTILEQEAFTKLRSHYKNLKTGVDYFIDKKTTAGVVYTGTWLTRASFGQSPVTWKNATGIIDSVISTDNINTTGLKQNAINFNLRHVFDASRELSADVDVIRYTIDNYQYFENRLVAPGSTPETSQGEIPTDINITTAKLDYSQRFKKMLWEAGLKTSHVATDNLAQYYILGSTGWEEDLGKTNHFLYDENIHAAYSSLDIKLDKWNVQGGLRYEFTSYRARQLGNAVNHDSSFNRRYGSLFPTLFASYNADSSNTFTFRAGRRIDRPVFQKLNPFLFIINKYTFQQGNPYFRPQYTWNLELSHVYKQFLSTSLTYSYTKDYFSQIFFSDASTGIIIYSEGNVGQAHNLGLTVSAQLTPRPWWSLSAQTTYNHKELVGVLWRKYKASIDQLTLNINNQFKLGKGWNADLGLVYITKNQNDLQEVLDPAASVSVGISKLAFKGKGTFRLTGRDIFYTQIMQGITQFETVVEDFRLLRDTRTVTFGFTYRFGKAMKQPKRSGGGAADEINRVNVN